MVGLGLVLLVGWTVAVVLGQAVGRVGRAMRGMVGMCLVLLLGRSGTWSQQGPEWASSG